MSDAFLNLGTDAPPTTRATPARALNTTFAINAPARRPVFASYSVRIAAAAGERGHVELRSDGAAPPTTVVDQAGGAAGAAAAGADTLAVPRTWFQKDVAANQAAVVMACEGGSDVTPAGTIWRAPRAGSLVGLSAQASEVQTAGIMTIATTINGVAQTSVAFGAGEIGRQVTASAGSFPYVAGDLIGCVITTDGAFLPLTLDVEAWAEVAEAGNGAGQSVTVDVSVSGWVYPGNNVRIVTVADAGAPVFTFLSSMEVQF